MVRGQLRVLVVAEAAGPGRNGASMAGACHGRRGTEKEDGRRGHTRVSPELPRPACHGVALGSSGGEDEEQDAAAGEAGEGGGARRKKAGVGREDGEGAAANEAGGGGARGWR